MIVFPKRLAPRSGLSLLEVLVALAIFLFSLVALGRLVTLGADRALEVEQRGHAAVLCRSKLAEVAAGVIPLSSQGDTPFDEDPDYTWSLDCEQGNVSGLWQVKVTVTRERKDGQKIQIALAQYLLDPSLRGSAMDSIAPASSGTSDSSSNSTSSSTPTTNSPSSGTSGSPKASSPSPTPTMSPSTGGTAKTGPSKGGS
jgi:prepilin-type N-terminal cleavage/methylation domain-containing protein